MKRQQQPESQGVLHLICTTVRELVKEVSPKMSGIWYWPLPVDMSVG